MTKPTIIFATLADHPQNKPHPDWGTYQVAPGDLVAVELPPNCAVDATTSEVQDMLSQVEDHLRMRVKSAYGGHPEMYANWKDNLDWIAADAVARVRTLLGAPRDGEREAFERVAKSAAAMLAHDPDRDRHGRRRGRDASSRAEAHRRGVEVRGGACDHRACGFGPCRQLSEEELMPSDADRDLAMRLVAEGWYSVSNKFRHLRRWRKPWPKAEDVIRPEMLDTWIGWKLAEEWNRRGHTWHLRIAPDSEVEELTLTLTQYRAFRQAGGVSAL